jgi:hypothetical protein
MREFIGEVLVENDKTKEEYVLLWIEIYGQYDGAHHKTWVLDQISRIINDTQIITKLASWSDGHQEKRYSLDKPSEKYLQWVEDMCDGEDGKNDYDFGVAP